MKKFLYWLIGKPWIQYAGNGKYVVRVRKDILTVSLGTDLYKWYCQDYVRQHCHVSKEMAFHIREEYLKTKQIL